LEKVMAPDNTTGQDKYVSLSTVVAYTGTRQQRNPNVPTVQQLITQSTDQALKRDSELHSGEFAQMPMPQQTNGDRPEAVANDDYGFPTSWLGYNQNSPPKPLAAANDTSSPQQTAQKEREDLHVNGLIGNVLEKHNAHDVSLRQRQALSEGEQQALLKEEEDEDKAPLNPVVDPDDEDDTANSNSKLAELAAAAATATIIATAADKAAKNRRRLPRGSAASRALRRARKASKKARKEHEKLKRRHEAARRRAEEAKRKHRNATEEHEKLRLANEADTAAGAEGKLAGKLATSEARLAKAKKSAAERERLSELAKKNMGGFRRLMGARKFGEGLVAGYFAVPALKAFAVIALAPPGQSSEMTGKMAQKVFYESSFSEEARAEFDKGNTAKGVEIAAKDFVKGLVEGAKDIVNFLANDGIKKIQDEWKWFVKFQKEHPEDAQVMAQMFVKDALGDLPTSMDAAGNFVYAGVTGDKDAKQKGVDDALSMAKKAYKNDPDALSKLGKVATHVTDAPPPSLGSGKEEPSRPTGRPRTADNGDKPAARPTG
jgi:hypothetical protein